MKTASLYFLLLLLLSGCKKDKSGTPSTWHINGEQYSEIGELSIAPLRAALLWELPSSNDHSFCIAFYNTGSLPSNGTYKADASASTRDLVYLSFRYHGRQYSHPAPNTHISVESTSGKRIFTLSPSWFYQDSKTSDSVMIDGVFSEP